MIAYNVESFSKVYEESKLMQLDNNEEICLFDLPLDVDMELFKLCELEGSLRTFTVRDEGELVGYAVFFLFEHPHHKTSLQAKQDVIFIRRDKRGRGITFIKYCDDELKKDGVEFVQHCIPTSNDWSPVLKRLGYRKLEEVYTRRL